MLLDHDLGGDDTTMHFLRWLAQEFHFGLVKPPDFTVHSANPEGTKNIQAFMASWKQVYIPYCAECDAEITNTASVVFNPMNQPICAECAKG